MKKSAIIILAIIILLIILGVIFYRQFSGFAVYAPNKIKISSVNDNIKPGENVSFSVDVFDENNIPIKTLVSIVIEDANKKTRIEKTISSGEQTNIELDKNANFGYWKIIASYKDSSNQIAQDNYLFNVEMQENVKFEMNNDVLTIENTGNSVYEKSVQIVIGNTIGTKNVRLDAGEKTDIRLTAPDGVYDIKISDGKNTLTKNSVQLTGKVIGVLDENVLASPPLTGLNPEKDDSFSVESFMKKQKFIYFFLAFVVGAAILLAIERNYRKKAEE